MGLKNNENRLSVPLGTFGFGFKALCNQSSLSEEGYFSIAVRVGMAALGLCESSTAVAARLPSA